MQVEDYSEADRHPVDPPLEVESATWSAGGTLDWWVKERQHWLGRVRVQMVVRSGSKPLIFVRRRRVDHRDLSLSFVVGRAITQWRIRLSKWLIVPGRAARARRHRSEALGQWLMCFD